MRLQIASDLHLEYPAKATARLERVLSFPADVLVLAGDLCNASALPLHLGRLCDAFQDVVYVLGNHEYWGHHVDSVHNTMATACARHRNLHWLHGNAATVGGVRFVGGTLWYPPTPSPWRHVFPDFLLIRGFNPWVHHEHSHMQSMMAAFPADVLVTHHAPSPRSAYAPGHNTKWEPFFFTDLEPALPNFRLAVHGHFHHRRDYTVGGTRVLCNPCGGRTMVAQVGLAGGVEVEVGQRPAREKTR